MPYSPQAKHILAINQSQDVLDLFKTLLEEDEGYRVTTQPYVQKDMKAIQEMAPDLIILDYMWDYEDAGWSFLQMVKMNPATQAIPIVLCTGAVNRVESFSAHLQRMGVRVVIKPFNLDELLREIALALDESGMDLATASAKRAKTIEPGDG